MPRITTAQRRQHAVLLQRHHAAQDVIDRSPTGATYRQVIAEQDAYDALVDYVDANDLTYTELDPRGPDDDHDEMGN